MPIIASGGVGGVQDFVDGVQVGGADALLAASVFHYGELTVGDVKKSLADSGIEVRM